MSASSYPTCAAFTRISEGGWADNPDDPGGATMEGITLSTYTAWCRQMGKLAPTATTLKAITDPVWNAIASTLYWNPVRGDDLPAGVDLIVWDFGFNAGIHTSGLILQKSLGFTGDDLDGWIGNFTLKAVAAKTGLSAFITDISSRQEAYYRSLAKFPEFGKGWLARNQQRRAAALGLVVGPIPVKAPVAKPPAPSTTISSIAVAPSPADVLNAAQIAKDNMP